MIIEKQWLTPNEAAKYLGVHVHTIYNYLRLKENPLQCSRISKNNIRINVETLEEWIKSYNLEGETK